MRSVLAAVVVGYLAARLTWLVVRPLFTLPALTRRNFRGRTVPTSVGIVLPLAAMLVEGGRAVAGSFGVGDGAGMAGGRSLVLLAALGFAVLGLLDDIAGTGSEAGTGSAAGVAAGTERGFRGHLGALAGGRVTTGVLKLLGGGVLALLVVAPVVGESPARLVADAALVGLCANLANLLDRAPGRTIKVGTGAFLLLAVAAERTSALSGTAVLVGAALGLVLDDLHERVMLGDTGSNVLGAVLGLGVVLACGPSTREVVLVFVGALNVAGELVSFSRVIDAVPPLRALDQAGRRD